MTSYPVLAAYDPACAPVMVVTHGTLYWHWITDARGTKRLMLDQTAWGGLSGSPVFERKGKVIGFITGHSTGESFGFALARPVDLITSFLRDNKIPTEK